MNTVDFRNSLHANLINNEYRTSFLGYYVKWHLVQFWLTPPTLIGSSESLLREGCKVSPKLFTQYWEKFIVAKSPLTFGNHPTIIRSLVDAVQQTLFETLETQCPGCTANPQIRSLCSEYATEIVNSALHCTIEYSELMDIDALRLLYNRPDMIPIEITRKRLYRYVEASDEQLDEILMLADTLCN